MCFSSLFQNIDTCNYKNAISVDAHIVTINVITIEPGKAYLQDTLIAAKDEYIDFQNLTYLKITDGEDDISCDSGVTREASGRIDDHGYVSLEEPKTTTNPTISPYDMPHHLPETIALISTSRDIADEERDLYGSCKSNARDSFLQGNNDLDVVPYGSQKTTANYSYVPQCVSDSTNRARLKEDLCEPEESLTEKELFSKLNVIDDSNPNESAMLFVDWTANDPPLYISNLSKTRQLENCIKQCQEEKEGLLSQLCLPPEVTETPNDDQLEQLEERWGLFIQDEEK